MWSVGLGVLAEMGVEEDSHSSRGGVSCTPKCVLLSWVGFAPDAVPVVGKFLDFLLVVCVGLLD